MAKINEEEKDNKDKSVEEQPTPKEEKKPSKQRKQKEIKKGSKLVHIDDFIEAIRPLHSLSAGKASGFKAFMSGNHYLAKLDDFVPHLERYLGKDVK